MFKIIDLPPFLQDKIMEDENGCWIWTGYIRPNGYGQFRYPKVSQPWLVHRLTYSLLKEDILPKMSIDHLCRVRSCCNPAHMEQVTHRENVLRGESYTAKFAQQTHCKRGHEFTPENIYRQPSHPPHHRSCKECMRLKNKRLADRRKAERHAQGRKRRVFTQAGRVQS